MNRIEQIQHTIQFHLQELQKALQEKDKYYQAEIDKAKKQAKQVWVKRDQAKNMLGVCDRTISRMIKKGQLETKRLGQHKLILMP